MVHRGIFIKINYVQGEIAPDNDVLGDQIPKLFLSRDVHLVNGIAQCCSHVAPVKVPEDRNPCLMFVAAEKKPPSKFTKKGEVLEDTHEKAQRGSRVQRCCSYVAPVKVPEDRNPCLTLFAAEKIPALRFTKKGEVLKSTHEIAMEAIRSRPSSSRDLASLGNIIMS